MSLLGKAFAGLWSIVKKTGAAAVDVLNPQKQIEKLGGRRVWISVVLTVLSMAFVIVSQVLSIPNNIVLAALLIPGGLGGSFVIGESVRDNNETKNQNE